MAEDPEISGQPPESPVGVTGTDHITVTGSNVEDTVAFYRDLLGMALVMRQPNLDQPEVTHLFFDTGDGRLLTFFVTEERESNPRPVQPGVGGVHHLAFRVETARLPEIKTALDAEGYRYSEFSRGAFHSLYTRDHNGLTVELVADVFEVPDDRRGEALALAHQRRVADGADYVEESHLQAALEELGLDAERNEIPDAPAGSGFADEDDESGD